MHNVNRFPSSKLKLDEFFLNWLSSPESQKLVRDETARDVASFPRTARSSRTTQLSSPEAVARSGRSIFRPPPTPAPAPAPSSTPFANRTP